MTARSHTRQSKRARRRHLIRAMKRAGVSNQTQLRALHPSSSTRAPRVRPADDE